MFLLQNYSTAVLFCVITMLCWGPWANTQKLAAGSWRFELFYWDYVMGIVLVAILFAFTLGNHGQAGRGFVEDVRQASAGNMLFPALGGLIFNAANILLVAAIAIAGMSVAFPVGIGIALVLGVLVNYIDNPTGQPIPLFSGVLLVVVAILLNAQAYRKKSMAQSSTSSKGLILSIVAGLLMGFFYRFVAGQMFKDFAVPEPGRISPYTALVFFSIGILVSNIVFNTYLMKNPFSGEPVSYADYFRGGVRNHLTGILGGMIWCVGMSFNIIASGKAGAAISYGLGQGATIIAALWGILIWREFRGAGRQVNRLIFSMLLFYIAGLALIIYAR
jgi:glucose uptake protein